MTFSEVAHLHYSWKYNVRCNVNSDISIVTIFRSLVESIEVIKKMKILVTEKEMVFLCYHIFMHY